MPSRQTVNQALARVHDLPTLTQHLLTDTLHWPIENKIETIEEISFGWTPQELQAQGLEEHLLDGQAWQIRPFREDQPWGIFVLEFADERVYRTALRQVLRGLVPNRRRDPFRPSWRARQSALHSAPRATTSVSPSPTSEARGASCWTTKHGGTLEDPFQCGICKHDC